MRECVCVRVCVRVCVCTHCCSLSCVQFPLGGVQLELKVTSGQREVLVPELRQSTHTHTHTHTHTGCQEGEDIISESTGVCVCVCVCGSLGLPVQLRLIHAALQINTNTNQLLISGSVSFTSIDQIDQQTDTDLCEVCMRDKPLP